MTFEKVCNLLGEERYEEAEAACDQLIANNELVGETLGVKGYILARHHRHEEALEYFEKSLSLLTTNPTAVVYYKSQSLFSIGKQKEGWATLYHWYYDENNIITSVGRRRGKVMFNHQTAPAVLHVEACGGFGDIFCLVRYLIPLAEKGYTLRCETKPNAVKLLQDSFPDIEVMPLASDYPSGLSGIPEFDYFTQINDLPYLFGTDIDTVPWPGPFLKADKQLAKKYENQRGKIGICWATATFGGKYLTNFAKEKSIPFNELKPLFTDPSEFVAIQQGEARFTENDCITDCLPKDERDLTFAETAALIENLDLVITIDTSVAHLAGAMGKPVWLMMHRSDTSWQFMIERPGASWNTRSPWYPTMRIFRQRVRGEWGPVIESIVDEYRRSSFSYKVRPPKKATYRAS